MRISIRLPLCALTSWLVACGGSLATPSDGGAGDGQVTPGQENEGGAPIDSGVAQGSDGSTPVGTLAGNKVDLLFMIDNSAGMGSKQALLAATVPDLLQRFVNPSCIDASGSILGPSSAGICAAGQPEFAPVSDLHIGIVSSSLGGRGGDLCAASAQNPANPSLNAHNDDQAHLIARGGADEHAVTDGASGFLAWYPSSPGPGQIGDVATLAKDFSDMVSGVDQYGCGFEAQLESWYRFLVQPDPFSSIAGPPAGKASLVGVDDVVLKQRHDFLRSDSILSIIVLTDENDSTVDPLSIGAQGWAFANSHFPNSPSGGAARATAACNTNPSDPLCTSCGFGQTPNDPECQKSGGYYDPQTEDALNERFFHMKQRFGVDPQFPISRYINALTSAKVPNRDGEHPAGSMNYVGQNNCTNPLFAASLPISSQEDLCNLATGPRGANDVFLTVIAGVPGALLRANPADEASAQKATLTASDWVSILGNDPLNYDFAGADPHMLESMTPRKGLADPTSSDNADPIQGREWDTAASDLQYACTFALPAPIDCTDPKNTFVCDCNASRKTNPPLCASATSTIQTHGKAYPAIRELSLARALGGQAIVSSICPAHSVEASPGDPLFGYRPAWDALIARMRTVLPAK